jgi:hypothetical protein
MSMGIANWMFYAWMLRNADLVLVDRSAGTISVRPFWSISSLTSPAGAWQKEMVAMNFSGLRRQVFQ